MMNREGYLQNLAVTDVHSIELGVRSLRNSYVGFFDYDLILGQLEHECSNICRISKPLSINQRIKALKGIKDELNRLTIEILDIIEKNPGELEDKQIEELDQLTEKYYLRVLQFKGIYSDLNLKEKIEWNSDEYDNAAGSIISSRLDIDSTGEYTALYHVLSLWKEKNKFIIDYISEAIYTLSNTKEMNIF